MFRFGYTGSGQRAKMTDASGQTRYAYDQHNRLRIAQKPQATLYYDYDAAGNITEISARRTYAFASADDCLFDPVRLRAESARPAGVLTTYDYDDRNRLVNVFSAGALAASYSYHAAGDLSSVAYPKGVTTTYAYNARHQLRRARAAAGANLIANFDYDEAGEGVDPLSARTTWGSALLSPSGRRNRMLEKISGAVRTVNYTYDNLNRLGSEAVGSSSLVYDTAAGYESNGYDPVGNRRTRAVSGAGFPGVGGQSNLAYDKNDRTENDANAETPSTFFDANGNRTTYNTWTYSYDFEDRLIGATDGSTSITLLYDGDGNRVQKTVQASGVTTTTSYLVEDRNPTGSGQVLEELAVEPSATGLVGRWRFEEGTGNTAGDDSGGNHTAALLNGTGWGSGPEGGGLNFDGVNDYASVPDAPELRLGPGMTIAFWVKKEAEASDYVRYVGKGAGTQRNYGVWDESGTGKRILFQVYPSSGTLLNFYSTVGLEIGRWYHVACTYDGSTGRIYVNGAPAGQQSATLVPWTMSEPLTFGYGNIHSYLPGSLDEVRIYSRALSASEIAGLAQKPCQYAYGLDLISQRRDGVTSYYGYDGLGSVRYLTDANGTVTDTYTYDAFGVQIGSTGANTPNNYRYTGEQWDSDLGMYYLRARYYHPDLGRFWTMDTFAGFQSDPMSLHKYLYCADNPVNYVDPLGHMTLSEIGGVTANMARMAAQVGWRVYTAYDRASTR